MKYNLPQEVSFNDETVYQSCFRICNVLNHVCKLQCDKCLYSTNYAVCLKDTAVEVMKKISKKYNVEEIGEANV